MHKLFFFLVFIPFLSKAQTNNWLIAKNGTITLTDSSDFRSELITRGNEKCVKDTTKCLYLYSDTAYKNSYVQWAIGYRVCVIKTTAISMTAQFYTLSEVSHYLNEYKNPLSKNIIVWMDKDIDCPTPGSAPSIGKSILTPLLY